MNNSLSFVLFGFWSVFQLNSWLNVFCSHPSSGITWSKMSSWAWGHSRWQCSWWTVQCLYPTTTACPLMRSWWWRSAWTLPLSRLMWSSTSAGLLLPQTLQIPPPTPSWRTGLLLHTALCSIFLFLLVFFTIIINTFILSLTLIIIILLIVLLSLLIWWYQEIELEKKATRWLHLSQENKH